MKNKFYPFLQLAAVVFMTGALALSVQEDALHNSDALPAVSTLETAVTETEVSQETELTEAKEQASILEKRSDSQISQSFTDGLGESLLSASLHPESILSLEQLQLSWKELEESLTALLEGYEGNWSVYVKDLKTGQTINLNEQPMESASLIKLYVMGAVMEQIQLGNLEETDQIDTLLENMITVSDNYATNDLVRALDPEGDHTKGLEVVNDFITRHGFSNTHDYNGLADASLRTSENSNHTSAKDCGELLSAIYEGDLVSHMASRKMENLLLNQKITYKIPSALPSQALSASKTGEIDNVENDTAIIYSPGGDFILCIMSGDWDNEQTVNDRTDVTVNGRSSLTENTLETIDHIHQITKTVYQYFNPSSQALEQLE